MQAMPLASINVRPRLHINILKNHHRTPALRKERSAQTGRPNVLKVGQKYPSSDYRELDDATSPTVRSTADINKDLRMTTIQRFLRTPQSLEILSEHIKSRTKDTIAPKYVKEQ